MGHLLNKFKYEAIFSLTLKQKMLFKKKLKQQDCMQI